MRRLLIDTDTGSDDVWAIIAALRAVEEVKVEAITVVCGNVPLDLCVKNALIAVDVADTYRPPVYRGMSRPMVREKLFTSEYVHGEDGLSNLNLPYPPLRETEGHAVQAIIDLIMQNPGEIEIVTLGPLTNLAMAYLLEPAIAKQVKKVYVMGASGMEQGNATPAAEFNVYVDAEAASVILHSGMDVTWVTWDVCRGETQINREDREYLRSLHSPVADFCVDCTRCLMEYEGRKYGGDAYGVIDSIIMTAVIYPEVMGPVYEAYCDIELRAEMTYGYFMIDKQGQLHKTPNAKICQQVDSRLYKERLFSLYAN